MATIIASIVAATGQFFGWMGAQEEKKAEKEKQKTVQEYQELVRESRQALGSLMGSLAALGVGIAGIILIGSMLRD